METQSRTRHSVCSASVGADLRSLDGEASLRGVSPFGGFQRSNSLLGRVAQSETFPVRPDQLGWERTERRIRTRRSGVRSSPRPLVDNASSHHSLCTPWHAEFKLCFAAKHSRTLVITRGAQMTPYRQAHLVLQYVSCLTVKITSYEVGIT